MFSFTRNASRQSANPASAQPVIPAQTNTGATSANHSLGRVQKIQTVQASQVGNLPRSARHN